MGWEHYQTVDPLKGEPQVGRGLSDVRLLILHFKFQFSKSIKLLRYDNVCCTVRSYYLIYVICFRLVCVS